MLSALGLGGCSVLVGNVRPVEEPASLDGVTEKRGLLGSPWTRIDPPRKDGAPGALIPAFSFQNEQTGSTIAFTSGCRGSYRKAPPSLRMISQSLGSGLQRIQKRLQEDSQVAGVPALSNTIVGWASGSEVTIHNVIFSREGCVFDLTLVSLSRHHEQDRPAFDSVLSALPISK